MRPIKKQKIPQQHQQTFTGTKWKKTAAQNVPLKLVFQRTWTKILVEQTAVAFFHIPCRENVIYFILSNQRPTKRFSQKKKVLCAKFFKRHPAVMAAGKMSRRVLLILLVSSVCCSLQLPYSSHVPRRPGLRVWLAGQFQRTGSLWNAERFVSQSVTANEEDSLFFDLIRSILVRVVICSSSRQVWPVLPECQQHRSNLAGFHSKLIKTVATLI